MEIIIHIEERIEEEDLEFEWVSQDGEIVGEENKGFYQAPSESGQVEIVVRITNKLGQELVLREEIEIIAAKQPELDLEQEYSEAEIELLARAVMGEAEGEPYLGQVAVAAVVLNRVDSKEFPDRIYDVLYQKNQFTIVESGRIELTPNESSINAAIEAIEGRDPSLGALFFYNPRTARNMDFFNSLKTTIAIANHTFAVAK